MTESTKPILFRPDVGKCGITELHWAAYCSDQNELEHHLASGADPNSKDEYRGYAAVHWMDMAATGGTRIQMPHTLIARGADINLVANNGATALSLAAEAGNALSEQLVVELVKLGAQA